MSRLTRTLTTLHQRGENAMGLFLTNGFPHPDSTVELLHAIDAGGADFIELGMPFSDPLAEGLPIQRSSARALAHGVTLSDAFDTVRAFRESSDTPVLLMGYINPVHRYGVDAFYSEAAEAGVDGLILPDLPPDEGGLIDDAAQAHGLDVVYLVAPNSTDARIRLVDERATGFVYAVSMTGLTGSSIDGVDRVTAYLQRARGLVTHNPLLVGFGIRSHADAQRLSEHTDGFIVGSALINEVERLWDETDLPMDERLKHVEAFARTLKYGEPAEAASH